MREEDKMSMAKRLSGDWYVFRHAATKADDEFRKLVPADTVSLKAQGLKQVLATDK